MNNREPEQRGNVNSAKARGRVEELLVVTPRSSRRVSTIYSRYSVRLLVHGIAHTMVLSIHSLIGALTVVSMFALRCRCPKSVPSLTEVPLMISWEVMRTNATAGRANSPRVVMVEQMT